MTKSFLILIVAGMMMGGCGTSHKPLSNEQIIILTKQCEDAGLRAVPYISGINFMIVSIQCAPK